MSAHKAPTGQEFLVCPTYDGPWSWQNTITLLSVVALIVFGIVSIVLIYWRHKLRLQQAA